MITRSGCKGIGVAATTKKVSGTCRDKVVESDEMSGRR
jgi:hypothetical protein